MVLGEVEMKHNFCRENKYIFVTIIGVSVKSVIIVRLPNGVVLFRFSVVPGDV